MAIFDKTTEDQKTETKTASVQRVSTDLRAVLVKPRVSEKANLLSNNGKYIFEVHRNANKISVKKAVEQAYAVKVTQVNIITMEGKKRSYGRTSGKMSDFKKAVVTLKKGDKIDLV